MTIQNREMKFPHTFLPDNCEFTSGFCSGMLSVNRRLLAKNFSSHCRGYHVNSPILNRYGDFNSNVQTKRFEDSGRGLGSRFGGEDKPKKPGMLCNFSFHATKKKLCGLIVLVEDVEVKRLAHEAEDSDPAATKQWRVANDISVVGMGVTCPPPILSFEQAPFIGLFRHNFSFLLN